MRPKADPYIEESRIRGPRGTNNGAFLFPRRMRVELHVVTSDGGGWDHVSVSLENRCPMWSEMCFVKGHFFQPDEVVMQLHPAEAEYINQHEFCLHLWRPQTRKEAKAIAKAWAAAGERPMPYQITDPIPRPPRYMVGLQQESSP